MKSLNIYCLSINNEDRIDFKIFLESNISYNRGDMFICNSKEIIIKYYESVFPWLEKCKKIFVFKDYLYGITRFYAFLAERYLSYWFNKYSKSMEWPVGFLNINTKNNLN